MTIRRELIEAFAAAIWAKSNVVRSVQLVDVERRRLMESISDDIKKCTDFATPRVSEAARAEAALRGVDLSSAGWHDQPRFNPGRQTFHREHLIPVGDLRERCLQADSVGAIVDILQRAEVAWILKSEDRKLSELGYRAIRHNPAEAYREAGIKLE